MEREGGSCRAYVLDNSKTLGIMVLNVAAVVGIVVVMKQLFQGYHYDFPIFLLVLHQFSTAFALWAMKSQGALEPKPLDTQVVLQLAVGEIGSIVFSNFSLLQNSVGMYQIYKLLNIPLMCVFEVLWLKSTFPTPIKLALAVILGGIAVATVSDVQYSAVGLVYGLLAVLATTMFQVQVKHVTKDKGVTGLQLSYCTALPKGVILTLLVPFLEKDPAAILAYPYSQLTVLLIAVTCVLGVLTVCTPAMIIQHTTPVTFQVVGHAKTCLIIASGYFFFKQPVVAKNVAGVLLALAGMVWYSYLKMPPAVAAAVPHASPPLEEEEPPPEEKRAQ